MDTQIWNIFEIGYQVEIRPDHALRINGYQCYVFRFCLRVFLINSGYFFFQKCQELIQVRLFLGAKK
jgi:hypothetical protein